MFVVCVGRRAQGCLPTFGDRLQLAAVLSKALYSPLTSQAHSDRNALGGICLGLKGLKFFSV